MKIPEWKLNRRKNAERKLCVNYCYYCYYYYYCAVFFIVFYWDIYSKIFVRPILRKTLRKYTLRHLRKRRVRGWGGGGWENIYLKCSIFTFIPSQQYPRSFSSEWHLFSIRSVLIRWALFFCLHFCRVVVFVRLVSTRFTYEYKFTFCTQLTPLKRLTYGRREKSIPKCHNLNRYTKSNSNK